MDRERQTMQQSRGKDQDERKGRGEESGLEFGRRREAVIEQNPPESVEARRIRARVHVEGCSEAVDQAKIIARTTRPSGGKDRHSKVNTAKGPRDRRVRLSVATAIQFYDVQDRLGYDQPSKAVEWLIKKAKHAIDELPPTPPIQYAVAKPAAAFCGSAPAAGGAGASSGYGYSEVLFGGSGSGSGFGNMFKEEDAEAEEQELGQAVGSWRQEERSISEGSKGSEGLGSPSARIESRAKARERARERTREKSCGRSPPRSGSGNLVENTFSFTNLLQSPMYTPAPAPAQPQAHAPQQSLHSQQNYSFHQQNHQNQNRQIHLQSLFQHSGPLPIQHNALERKPNYPPPSFLHPEAQPRSPLLSRPPPPSSMGSFLSSEFNPFAGISADHFSSLRPPSAMPVDDHSSHSVRSFPFLNNPPFYFSPAPASAPSSSPSENLGHILRPSPASLFDYQRDLRHFSSYQPHVPARIHGIDEMDQNLKHHSSPSP